MMQSMLVMPIVFGYIGFTFPSGAVLYWVVGSVLSMIQQYVISGWGSLANYLKFLPTDGGLFPPSIPATAAAAASAANTGGVTDAQPVKREFWDLLSPLNNADDTESAITADKEDQDERPSPTVRRPPTEMNPRRRRSRR